MTFKEKIRKVLVVLSPDLIQPAKPMKSALLQRAVSLAKKTECELELFHVCFDGALDFQIFANDEAMQKEREQITNRAATQLAEVVTRLKSEHPQIRYETRWDSPRSDAILRKIAEAKPDIVMKQAKEHSYVLGITSNTDWDLARRSPADIWLVNEEVDDINRIVSAVGNKFGDPGDITTAKDFEVLRTAGLVAARFGAEIYPVNAYQVPTANYVAGGGGMIAPVASTAGNDIARKQVLKKHSAAVEALAQYFSISKNNVRIEEGHPGDVIPAAAKSMSADMIVMGANSISRLERLVTSVTVEPVISDTNCDILIVRDGDQASIPDAARRPLYGIPKYDLEQAIIDPGETFSNPQEVADNRDISIEMRNRILQAWEHDIRAQMTGDNEGGPISDMDASALDDILSAKETLAMIASAGNSKKAGSRRLSM